MSPLLGERTVPDGSPSERANVWRHLLALCNSTGITKHHHVYLSTHHEKMPTKRQIENAHMRGAYLALAFTNSMTWREIEDLFPSIPSGTMKHNMLRAKRSCVKDDITDPTLRELLLHAEEAPRGGAEARLMYPVGSAISEKLKERAMHYEGQKDVPLKQVVEEASAATGVKVALSTAVRILKDHHGIQKRGPNKKRRLTDKTASTDRSKSDRKSATARAQKLDQSLRPEGHLSAGEQGTTNGDITLVSHHAPNQQTTSNGYQVASHTESTNNHTSVDSNAAAQVYMAADHQTVAGDSDTAVQQNRVFQFTPSDHFPLYDLSAMRNPYQSQNDTTTHDNSFSNYIDPNLNPEQENGQQVS